jgi:hypothetical protein
VHRVVQDADRQRLALAYFTRMVSPPAHVALGRSITGNATPRSQD